MFGALKQRILRHRHRALPPPASSADAVDGSNSTEPGSPGRASGRGDCDRLEQPVGDGGAEEPVEETFSTASTHTSRDVFMNDDLSVVGSDTKPQVRFGGEGRTRADAVRGRDVRERVRTEGYVECAVEEEKGLLGLAKMVGEAARGQVELVEDVVRASNEELAKLVDAEAEVSRMVGFVERSCEKVAGAGGGSFGGLLTARAEKMAVGCAVEEEKKEEEGKVGTEEAFFRNLRWKERLWDLEEALGEARMGDGVVIVGQLKTDDLEARSCKDMSADFRNLVKNLAMNLHTRCSTDFSRRHLRTLAELGFGDETRSAVLASAREALRKDLARSAAIFRTPCASRVGIRFASLVVTKLFTHICVTYNLYVRLGDATGTSSNSSSPAGNQRAPGLFAWMIEEIDSTYAAHLQPIISAVVDTHFSAKVVEAIRTAVTPGLEGHLDQLYFVFNTRMIQLLEKDICLLLKSYQSTLAKVVVPKLLAKDPLTSTHPLKKQDAENLSVYQGKYGVSLRDMTAAVGSWRVSTSAIEICRVLCEFSKRTLFPLRDLSVAVDAKLEQVICWGMGMYARFAYRKAGTDARKMRVAELNAGFVGGVWGSAWGGEVGRIGMLVATGSGADLWWREVRERGKTVRTLGRKELKKKTVRKAESKNAEQEAGSVIGGANKVNEVDSKVEALLEEFMMRIPTDHPSNTSAFKSTSLVAG